MLVTLLEDLWRELFERFEKVRKSWRPMRASEG